MKVTLVQHSGYGYGGNPQFSRAVESHSVTTKAVEQRVIEAGGVLLEPAEALSREEAENYPPDVTGLIPRVQGTFSRKQISGLRIYVPAAGEKQGAES